ncbi:MAG: Single-stranded DNA-binding protein [Bacteroidetes bacterium ADurb.Bin408]|nr:MAG: Single-stranded DNA-binding protein [Bacteroidetes bacterium ADurb.Bin408]
MIGVNRVILIGNLGRDPEIRQLESGTKVATFSLATTESYKNKEGNKIDQTEWHNIVLWRGLAEVAEKHLKKGNTIYIEGKIRTRSWDDKDGNKRYTTEIVGDNITMLGGRKEQDGMSVPNTTATPEQPDVIHGSESDDLPF